jgi:3-hydroxybutyrate dehydrogenase
MVPVHPWGSIIRVPREALDDEDKSVRFKAAEALGKLGNACATDALMDVPGIQHIDPIENFPMPVYDLMQKIMLRAPFYLSKLCIPHIKGSEDGTGAIGNMSSIHGHIVCR